MQAFEQYLVGAGQGMIGAGRAEGLDKFLELLNSGGPDRVKKLEEEIRQLHGMRKFERFRTQFYLIAIDIFQSGMYFALEKKAADSQWDLLKVLGLFSPESSKE